jgi:1,2-phenylacetyl-CoA epoxidase catalytic subunit
MNTEAIKDLLYKMADDALIIGHRNSEWTGIGPMLEERSGILIYGAGQDRSREGALSDFA